VERLKSIVEKFMAALSSFDAWFVSDKCHQSFENMVF